MAQAEFDRIGASSVCQLVHEALQRKDVHVGAKPAQGQDAQRHLRNEAVHDRMLANL
jgi:hypothetical protein